MTDEELEEKYDKPSIRIDFDTGTMYGSATLQELKDERDFGERKYEERQVELEELGIDEDCDQRAIRTWKSYRSLSMLVEIASKTEDKNKENLGN